MNNTDLQVRFNKETKQQVLQTGKQMNLYYTDEYVRWLEDIALKQANAADTEQDKCHIQRVSFSEERAEVCEIDGCNLRPYGDLKVCKHHFLEQIDKQA